MALQRSLALRAAYRSLLQLIDTSCRIGRVQIPVVLATHCTATERSVEVVRASLNDDDDERTYSGNLIELGPSSIKIEGCWLMICDSEDLTRIK